MANAVVLKIRVDSNGALVLEDLKGKVQNLGKTAISTGDVLHKVFASKILIDAINNTKMAIRYSTVEVLKYQDAMTKTGVIGELTAKELGKISDTIINISNNSKYAATVLADAGLEMSKAGIRGAESEKLLKDVSDFATASQGDLTEAMMLTISVMNSFGLNMDHSTRIVNVMHGAISGSTAGFEDFGEAMKYIAPVANSLGQSLEETSAQIAKLADGGLKGSIAGTTLKNALLNLQVPGDAVGKVVEKLGKGSYTLTDVFKALQEEGISVSDVLETMQMRAITGTLYLGKMEEQTGSLSEMTKNLREQVVKVSDDAAKIREGSWLEGFLSLGNSFVNVFHVVGSVLEEANITPFLKEWKDEMIDLQNYIERNPEAIVKMADEIASLVKIIGGSLIQVLKFAVEHSEELANIFKLFLTYKTGVFFVDLAGKLGIYTKAATGAKAATIALNIPLAVTAGLIASSIAPIYARTKALENMARMSERLADAEGLDAKILFADRMSKEDELLFAMSKRKDLLEQIATIEKKLAEMRNSKDYRTTLEGKALGGTPMMDEYSSFKDRLSVLNDRLKDIDKVYNTAFWDIASEVRKKTGIEVDKFFKNFSKDTDWEKLSEQLKKEKNKDNKYGDPSDISGEKGKDKDKGKGEKSKTEKEIKPFDVNKYMSELFSATDRMLVAVNYLGESTGIRLAQGIHESFTKEISHMNLTENTVSGSLEPHYGNPAASSPKNFGMSDTSNEDSISIYNKISKMELDTAKAKEEFDDRRIENLTSYSTEIDNLYSAQLDFFEQATEYTTSYWADLGNQIADTMFNVPMEMLIEFNEQAYKRSEDRHKKEMTLLSKQRDWAIATSGESASRKKIIEQDFRRMESQLLQEKEKEEAEYHRKEKAYALISAIINTALSITKVFSSMAPPASFVLAALTGVAGAAQIATISAQNFRWGRTVKGDGNGTSDSVPAMLSKGEYVVPEDVVSKVGGEYGIESMLESALNNDRNSNKNINVYVENFIGNRSYVRELVTELKSEEIRW